MKQQFVILLFALLSALPASAQQALVMKRSQTPLLYPEFREAKILQPFGRFVTAKANIFLKDGSLVYLDDKTGKVMRAYVSNIIGVNFGDSVRYLKVDSVMARVVAEKNYNYLLCNTHVNMSLYREDYYDRDNPDIKGISEVIIGKQRNGPVGTVKLRWESNIGKFTDLEQGGGEHPLPPPPQSATQKRHIHRSKSRRLHPRAL